jgi:hypothetical protein
MQIGTKLLHRPDDRFQSGERPPQLTPWFDDVIDGTS